MGKPDMRHEFIFYVETFRAISLAFLTVCRRTRARSVLMITGWSGMKAGRNACSSGGSE
jgi:hypothetical protein